VRLTHSVLRPKIGLFYQLLFIKMLLMIMMMMMMMRRRRRRWRGEEYEKMA
jgi:hypothetical protein